MSACLHAESKQEGKAKNINLLEQVSRDLPDILFNGGKWKCVLAGSRSRDAIVVIVSLGFFGTPFFPSFSQAPVEWRRKADASVCTAPLFKLGRAVVEFARMAHAGRCFLEVNPLSFICLSGALVWKSVKSLTLRSHPTNRLLMLLPKAEPACG